MSEGERATPHELFVELNRLLWTRRQTNCQIDAVRTAIQEYGLETMQAYEKIPDDPYPDVPEHLRPGGDSQARAPVPMERLTPLGRQQIVVCAACRLADGSIIHGPRHWDAAMHRSMEMLFPDAATRRAEAAKATQGFIDQHGVFLTRAEALALVRQSGQPFDARRNGSTTELFSEGLY